MNPYAITIVLMGVFAGVVLLIAISALLKGFIWWLLGIQKQIDLLEDIARHVGAPNRYPPKK